MHSFLIIEKLDLDFIENEFLITSLHYLEMLIRNNAFWNIQY
jgi:hypothetical protein